MSKSKASKTLADKYFGLLDYVSSAEDVEEIKLIIEHVADQLLLIRQLVDDLDLVEYNWVSNEFFRIKPDDFEGMVTALEEEAL